MDTRDIDNKCPLLSFDLAKMWAARAFARQLGASCHGESWQALTVALGYAFGRGASISEARVRQKLVTAYEGLHEDKIFAVLKAKLEDPWSFFHIAKYEGNLEVARKHWTWYIYCLAFESSNVSEAGSPIPLAAMPLDTVDLQVIANSFRVQITIARLLDEPLRVIPRGNGEPAKAAVHLVYHCGRWASLLGSRPPEAEPLPIVHAIVELGDLPGELCRFSRRGGVVADYNHEEESYTVFCDEGDIVHVERGQIARVLYRNSDEDMDAGGALQEDSPATSSIAKRGAKANSEKTVDANLVDVPMESLEFQILHELVRREVSGRLEATMKELAGTGGQPREQNRKQANQLLSAVPTQRAPARPEEHPPVSSHSASSREPGVPVANGRDESLHVAHERGADMPVASAATDRPTATVVAAPAAVAATFAATANGAHSAHEIPPPARPDTLFNAQATPAQRRVPFNDVETHLGQSPDRGVTIIPPLANQEEGRLCFAQYEEVRICQVHRYESADVFVLGARTQSPESFAWVDMDKICVFEAVQDFIPGPEWDSEDKYLRLAVGDMVVLIKRYDNDWRGWAFGMLWGGREAQGAFHIGHVRPMLICQGWPQPA